MNEIIDILSQIKPGIDFAKEENMIRDGILTSMEVLMLVSQLEEEFDIEIELPYVIPQNFESVEAIYKLVQMIEDEE